MVHPPNHNILFSPPVPWIGGAISLRFRADVLKHSFNDIVGLPLILFLIRFVACKSILHDGPKFGAFRGGGSSCRIEIAGSLIDPDALEDCIHGGELVYLSCVVYCDRQLIWAGVGSFSG